MRLLSGCRREAWAALLGSTLVACAMTWPALEHPASTVPGDLGDPMLEAYTLGWDGHALIHQPLHVFDANVFYPYKNSLAFTDSLFGYAPVSWIGGGPTAALVRYNLVYVFTFALCGWGAYLLARQLGCRPAGAMVAGAVFGYAPWKAAQAGHLQILSCGAVPLALALLARGHGLRAGGRRVPDFGELRPRCIVLGWVVAAWQVSIGFGVGLQWAYLLLGLAVVTVVWWALRGRVRPPRRLVTANLAGGVIFVVVSAYFAIPSLQAAHDHPESKRTLADLQLFSPPLRGFFITPATNWLWGDAQTSERAGLTFPPEMALGLGGLTLVLVVLGVAAGSWRRTRRWLVAASALVLLVCALGTQGPDGGRFTYLVLYHHLPGFTGIRTPGRLVVTLMVPLALLAAQGADAAARVLARVRVPMAATGAAVACLVLVEGLAVLAHPTPPAPPLAALHTGSGPAVVIPTDPSRDEITMWWTTDDYEPITNGAEGFTLPLTSEIRDDASMLPTAAGFDGLRALGVRRVVAVLSAYGADSQALLLGPLPAGVTRTVVGDDAVFQLK